MTEIYMEKKSLPRLVITFGDPAGIGPELCWMLLQDPDILKICEPVVLGESEILLDAANSMNPQHIPENQQLIQKWMASGLFLNMGFIHSEDFSPGTVNRNCGLAAYRYIKEAIRMCKTGTADALVTAPIHKEAFHLADVPFVGHTEILVAETGAQAHVMMLTSPEITAALVTAHVGYTHVPENLTVMRVLETILLTADAMRRIRGRKNVCLTVCGLNPHAGEHGLFGNREEEEIILPAMKMAENLQPEGLTLIGPVPPDTAFIEARRKVTDAYVCMTHDQGLIPLKTLAFDSAVNVTLGLTIIRTSVDHGTAMDIARKGKASVESLKEAVRLAVRLTGTVNVIS
ncbi:MAG: 4-hydroxythreonine-4-phosphate dehydrogenase PdxA [Planctomycetia bacterium]|nr:4-hydroxythreonine-4-phosphate dehydrogenase PdxA [Planctomycetia bacterium]